MLSPWLHAGMKFAIIAEKWKTHVNGLCTSIFSAMFAVFIPHANKSQSKHIIVFINILRIDYVI